MSISFEGFDSAALDQVIVSRYSMGSAPFTTLLQRDNFLLSKSQYTLQVYDKAHGYIDWPYNTACASGSDWQIDVPNAGRRYRIAGISGTDESMKVPWGEVLSSGDMCYNACTQYDLDGRVISTGYTSASYGSYGGAGTTAVLQRQISLNTPYLRNAFLHILKNKRTINNTPAENSGIINGHFLLEAQKRRRRQASNHPPTSSSLRGGFATKQSHIG